MKKYVAPTYEMDAIETEDIMNASDINVEQDITSSITNASTSLDNLLNKIESTIRFDE